MNLKCVGRCGPVFMCHNKIRTEKGAPEQFRCCGCGTEQTMNGVRGGVGKEKRGLRK